MRVAVPVSLAALLLSTGTVAFAQSAPIVMPGAPSESRVIDAGAATRLANTGYSPADATFMQHMFVHHQQWGDWSRWPRHGPTNPRSSPLAGASMRVKPTR